MKKVIFGLLACATLLAVSCETTDTAADDQLYEQGIEKGSIKLKRQSIEKGSIKLKRQSIEKGSIKLKR